MQNFLISLLISALLAMPAANAQSTTDPATTGSTSSATTQSAQQPLFSDVPATQTNFVAIKFLKDQGVISGYTDGSFKPDALVNRAEALKILLGGNKVEVPAQVETSSFPDVKASEWFAGYVEKAKLLGIVKGNDDGTFAPARNVNRAEFLKMLLILNNFLADKWAGKQLYDDVPATAWFAPYMNYAGQSGLLTADAQKLLFPSRELSRGEVAEIMYLMLVIRNDQDVQFLINQVESQLAQIDVYMSANNLVSAKRAASLAVDISQQAYQLTPADPVVLGAAKLARAYDYLMNAYISALQDDFVTAKDWIAKTLTKADEASAANDQVLEIADHIKFRANELLAQFPAN
jgi:hypothetical protein